MRLSVGVTTGIERFILASGVIVAAIGTMVLIGWSGGWRLLTGIRAAYVPMAPNSALLFVLLGGSSSMQKISNAGQRSCYTLLLGNFV